MGRRGRVLYLVCSSSIERERGKRSQSSTLHSRQFEDTKNINVERYRGDTPQAISSTLQLFFYFQPQAHFSMLTVHIHTVHVPNSMHIIRERTQRGRSTSKESFFSIGKQLPSQSLPSSLSPYLPYRCCQLQVISLRSSNPPRSTRSPKCIPSHPSQRSTSANHRCRIGLLPFYPCQDIPWPFDGRFHDLVSDRFANGVCDGWFCWLGLAWNRVVGVERKEKGVRKACLHKVGRSKRKRSGRIVPTIEGCL